MFNKLRNIALISVVAVIIFATVIICVCAAACSGGSIPFNATYYFVCYRTVDNSVSASSLSGAASSYGGAGYILNWKDNYYVTLSCYYTERDAETVCASLKKRDLDCSVMEVEIEKFKIRGISGSKNAQLYTGNLNTLNSLSRMAYECANSLDTGKYSQSNAKNVAAAIKNGIEGLLNSNPDNCFTEKLRYLLAECEDKEQGFLPSKDMRYLQIALADAIINAELY